MIEHKLNPWTPKLLWFLVPSIAGATLWWYIVAETLHGRVGFSSAALVTLLVFLVFGVFAFALWLGSYGLLAYVAPRWTMRLVLAAVVTLPILVYFRPGLWTFVGAGLTWLAVWWGIERAHNDAHGRIKVQPHFTLPAAFSAIATLIMIVVSLLYYQQLRGSARTSQELVGRLSDQTVSVAERFLQTAFKEYRPDMTVDEVIGLQVPSAAELLKDIDFDNLNQADLEERLREALGSIEGYDPADFELDPSTTQEELTAELDAKLNEARTTLSAQVRENLADQFQVPINGADEAHDVLTRIVNHQFDRYAGDYIGTVPWLLALALFFILRIFVGIFVMGLTWVGWLMLRLYRSLHVVRLDHQMVPGEFVEWK